MATMVASPGRRTRDYARRPVERPCDWAWAAKCDLARALAGTSGSTSRTAKIMLSWLVGRDRALEAAAVADLSAVTRQNAVYWEAIAAHRLGEPVEFFFPT